MTTLDASPRLDSAMTLVVVDGTRLTLANSRIRRPGVPASWAPSAYVALSAGMPPV